MHMLVQRHDIEDAHQEAVATKRREAAHLFHAVTNGDALRASNLFAAWQQTRRHAARSKVTGQLFLRVCVSPDFVLTDWQHCTRIDAVVAVQSYCQRVSASPISENAVVSERTHNLLKRASKAQLP